MESSVVSMLTFFCGWSGAIYVVGKKRLFAAAIWQRLLSQSRHWNTFIKVMSQRSHGENYTPLLWW